MNKRSRKTPRLTNEKLADWKRRMQEEEDPAIRTEIQKENPRAIYRQYDDYGELINVYNPEEDASMDNKSADEKYSLVDAIHRMDDQEIDREFKRMQLPENEKKEIKERFIRNYYDVAQEYPHPADYPSMRYIVKSFDAIMDGAPNDPECITKSLADRDIIASASVSSASGYSESAESYMLLNQEKYAAAAESVNTIAAEDPHVLSDKALDLAGEQCITSLMISKPFEYHESAGNYIKEQVLYSGNFTDDEKNVYYLVYVRRLKKKKAAACLKLSDGRISQILGRLFQKLRNDPGLRRYVRFT